MTEMIEAVLAYTQSEINEEPQRPYRSYRWFMLLLIIINTSINLSIILNKSAQRA